MERYVWSRYNLVFGEPGERYLVNTFTGSLQPLTDEAAALVMDGGALDAADSAVVEDLLQMGAIKPEYIDERQALLELRSTNSHSSNINSLAFWLMLTERCNYRCYYCYEDRDRCQDIAYTAADWLAFLDKFPALNDLHITWYGGEPLLNFACLEELAVKTAEYCKQRGLFFRQSLITNAVLLSPSIACRLKELGLSRVQITLDGPKFHHERAKLGKGTFETVMDNLYYAATLFPVSVRINVDRSNAKAIPELLELLAKRGFANLKIYFASITLDRRQYSETPSTFTTGEFAVVEHKLRQKLPELGYPLTASLSGARIQPCGAAGSTFYTVGVDGSLAKCPHLMGQELAGDILNGILPTTFSHPWLKQNTKISERCLACLLLPQCLGGCPFRQTFSDSRGDSCDTSRFNLVDSLRLAVSAAKSAQQEQELFAKCSVQEKLNQLERSAKGAIVSRRHLRQAALRGGGLGMLLAGMGYETDPS